MDADGRRQHGSTAARQHGSTPATGLGALDLVRGDEKQTVHLAGTWCLLGTDFMRVLGACLAIILIVYDSQNTASLRRRRQGGNLHCVGLYK